MIKHLKTRLERWWLSRQLNRLTSYRIELQYDAAEIGRERAYYDAKWEEINHRLAAMSAEELGIDWRCRTSAELEANQ